MDSVEDSSLITCRDYIKYKLLKSADELQWHDKEKMQIMNLFERTARNCESNSALLIGPRSSGKSVLVNSVLSELSEHKDFRELALIVYLNGLIHTDDSVALKAIAHQMNLNHALEGRTFGSFAENLSFFLECLKSGDRNKSKSTIIILDEFDLFCCRAKQTLLYNLFDVAQSAEAPLCVLGLTCRLDVVELLEKRVKSRFSNRQIYLFPESKKSKELIEHCQDLLSLPPSVERELQVDQSVVGAWNKEVKALCSSAEVQNAIANLHHIDISERLLRMFLVQVVSKLHCNNKNLLLSDFIAIYQSYLEDGKVKILESLSVLEVCVIVAMKQHFDIYDEEPFNFEMVLRTYLKFISQNSLDYTTDRSVIMKAFENIANLELIIPIKSTNQVCFKEFQMYRLALLPKQIQSSILNYQHLPTEVRQWVKNSIH